MVNHMVLTLVVNSFISFFAIVGNSVMIIAFISRHHLRTSANWLTVSTFVAGFIAGLYYPLLGLVDAYIIENNPFCFIVMSLGVISGLLFTLSVGAMTVERYISICYPLHAVRIITPRRVIFVISALYIYALIIIGLPAMTPIGNRGDISGNPLGCRLATVYNVRYGHFVLIQYLAPIPIMLITYCRIFFVLRRHIRAIADLPKNPCSSETVGPADAASTGTATVVADVTRERRLWKRELRSVTLLCTLVTTYMLSWLPFVVFLQTAFYNRGSPIGYSLVHSVVFLGAVINPFLYGFGNRAFRKVVLSIFCRRESQRQETF